jgi:hypothetical protein
MDPAVLSSASKEELTGMPFSLTVTEELAKIFESDVHNWIQLKTEQEKEQHTLHLASSFNVRWAAVNAYILLNCC